MRIPYLHKSRPRPLPISDAERALAAELRRDVEILATDIGPRGTFAPERYAVATQFLESSLAKAGYEVRRQVFEVDRVPCVNLEASIVGTANPHRMVILGAHYDSVRGCPAANDNASGVAGVLAAARALRSRSFRNTLRFVLFANEEPPYFCTQDMGSQRYARASREAGEDIRGMVCLETIGCYLHEKGSQRWPHGAPAILLPSTGDFIAFVGRTPSRALIKAGAERFRRAKAFPLVAAAVPEAIGMVGLSDHQSFQDAGYQAFMVTDTAPLRYPHYHLPTDTPDKIDFESMARVVRGLTAMTAGLADAL